MWWFKKTVRVSDTSVFHRLTDWHSHILPGVDDGVETLEEALQILDRYEALGVHALWLTPHVMEDMPNTPQELRERFEELKAAYKGSVELRLAAENMLDNLFDERLEQGELLPIGAKGDHLLVETSYFNPPMDLYGTLRRVKAKGYHPVLAHPERYVYMSEKDYTRLREMGVKFQLNLFSLAGMYGKGVRKKAEMFLQKGMYDRVGSDIHGKDGLETFLNSKLEEKTLKNIHL